MLGIFYFHRAMIKMLPVVLFLFFACSGQKEQTASTPLDVQESVAFRVPYNTVYKVYPDGTAHLIQEKEFLNNGAIDVERQYISRVEPNDSSGYFYSLYREYRYVYSDDGRLSERLNYEMGNHDSLLLRSKEMYTWKGDTVIHSTALKQPNGEGFQEPEEVDRTVHDAKGRVVYSKVMKGIEWRDVYERKDRIARYVVVKHNYQNAQLESTMIINRDNVHEYPIFGKAVPTNAILKRSYRNEGGLLSDTVFFIDYDRVIESAEVTVFNEYDEIISYSMCEGNPRGEEVEWIKMDVPGLNSMFLPPRDLDPMTEVRARQLEPMETLENWEWERWKIKHSRYTYHNGLIQTRKDEFENSRGASQMIQRDISYHYDEDLFLVKQTIEVEYGDGRKEHHVVECQRYEDGQLERLIQYVDGLRVRETHLSPTGMYVDEYKADRKNDSTVWGTFVKYRLSHSYRAAESVEVKNGEFVRGYMVLSDSLGRVTRYFAEDQGMDASFYYEDGAMKYSTHRKIRFTYFPESMHENDVYELHYGRGYSFEGVLFSPFVPYIDLNI